MEIVVYPDPRLKIMSEPVEKITEEFKEFLVEKFYPLMKEKDGMGLAAPQIGINERFFCFDTSHISDGIKRFVINPEIIFSSEENATFEEGCLSVPEIFAKVERSEKVRVRYYNEKGELKEEDLEGFNARVFLHEYDHLQGLLFIHRLSPVERIKVNSGLKELKRRYKNEN